MSIWLQISGLVLSILVGGLLSDMFKRTSHLKLLLSFSGGFLIALIFLHILPESYESYGNRAGFCILIGFLLQLALEYFSKGAEHGHFHVHEHAKSAFPLAIFLSLSVHALIESVPLGTAQEELNPLYWGILLHKIPEGITLSVIFRSAGYSARYTWIMLLIFSIIAPCGYILGYCMTDLSFEGLSLLLAVVVGMLIHVSTTIIFESSESHKISLLKLTAIVLGFAAAALIP